MQFSTQYGWGYGSPVKSCLSYAPVDTRKLEDMTFPFHKPDLRLPAAEEGGSPWDLQLFGPDYGATLIPSEDFKTNNLGDILVDDKTPVLAFTPRCWQEMHFLATHFDSHEWAAYLVIKRLSNVHPHFLAFDWFMPGQDVSGSEVSIQQADTDKYTAYIMEHYPEYYTDSSKMNSMLVHVHSHHRLGLAQFSHVDDTQQFSRDELGFKSPFRMYMLMLADGRVRCSMVIYEPALVRIPVALAVDYSSPELTNTLTKQRKNEILGICNDVMVRRGAALANQVCTSLPATGTKTQKAAIVQPQLKKVVPAVHTTWNSEDMDTGYELFEPDSQYQDSVPVTEHVSDDGPEDPMDSEPYIANGVYPVRQETLHTILQAFGLVYQTMKNQDQYLDETFDIEHLDLQKDEDMFPFTLSRQEEDGLKIIGAYAYPAYDGDYNPGAPRAYDCVAQMSYYFENREVLQFAGFDRDWIEDAGLMSSEIIQAIINVPTNGDVQPKIIARRVQQIFAREL